MSDNAIVLIVIAVVAGIVIAVWLIRERFKQLQVKVDDKEVKIEAFEPNKDTKNEDMKPRGVSLKGTKLEGEDHSLDISRGNVKLEDTEFKGKGHKLKIDKKD